MGSVDLAETSMPSGLTQQQQQGVHQAIDESFVAAFNFLMWIATAWVPDQRGDILVHDRQPIAH